MAEDSAESAQGETAERPRTLLIRHLPSHLSLNEREDLLRFFGAKAVRCMSDSGAMKYGAFAVFDTADQATNALQELHQLEVLGSRLAVQYSTRQFLHDAPVKIPKVRHESEKKVQATVEELVPIVPEDIDHLSSYHKVEYPINPKLMYSYPPPTVEILTNIANALASVPKFYVQVLHLMNKMNLPAPFGPVTQAPPVPSGISQQSIQEMDMQISSSEESELESDEDRKKGKPALGVKRARADGKMSVKRHKLQKIVSAPKIGKALKRHEVFERPPTDKEKIKSKESRKDAAEKSVVREGNVDPYVRKFITLHELERHRISWRRMKRTPLFQDYEPGNPSSRLLVENLHKDVPEATITFVFGRYINWENSTEKQSYSVTLDRDSKSCVVSFPSEDIAELALQETNGYKLMGEYMIVKFLPKPEPVVEDVAESVTTADDLPSANVTRDTAASVIAIAEAFGATDDVTTSDAADSTASDAPRAATPEMTGGDTPERRDASAPTTPEPDQGHLEHQLGPGRGRSNADKSKDLTQQKPVLHGAKGLEDIYHDDPRYISKAELDKGRIAQDKMYNFKVFNNYNPGEVSNRLYIKNLNHKQIQESEFIWLFGGFLRDRQAEAAGQLEVKIMKEGRMKGQAFVTFPSSAEADKTLRSCNGFVLHGKPMVIVFGKQS